MIPVPDGWKDNKSKTRGLNMEFLNKTLEGWGLSINGIIWIAALFILLKMVLK